MSKASFRDGAMLGLLSMVGPLAIDLYLPAFPAIAADLHASPAQVQLTMVSFFFALAFGQLIYGSLSDVMGRKIPLYGGLILFVISSIGCSLATDIHALIALRFLQGFGACAGSAISRAIIRDLHTGPAAARLLAMVFLVLGVSPILAPSLGGLLLTVTTWRTLFWVIAAMAAAALIVVFLLPETHPPEKRSKAGFRQALKIYAKLTLDRRYMGLVLCSGFVMAMTFVYVAGAPFVLHDFYGAAPWLLSILISVNAASQIISTQFSPQLLQRFGAERQLKMVGMAAIGVSGLLLLLVALHAAPLAIMVLLCSCLFACLGLLLTPASITALDGQGANAGSAAALMGSLQLLTAATSMAIVSLFATGAPLPWAAGLFICALLSHSFCRAVFWTKRAALA